MVSQDPGFDSDGARGNELQNQPKFLGGFRAILPNIVGYDRSLNLSARHQTGFNQPAGKTAGIFATADGGEADEEHTILPKR